MHPCRPAPRRLALTAALALPLSAAAQNALAPAIVTATRTPQPAQSVLADVRVIDADAIARAGAATLAELLRGEAGVEIAASGGIGQPASVFVRGTNFNHVVVLVDGVRVNSATTGANAFEHLPLAQIERIEVLRGPASGLYGADAIGGVIQIFTRQGERTTARLGAGRWDTWQADAGFGRRLGDAAVSLQAGALSSRSFSATVPSSFSFDPDRDAYRNRNLGASVGGAWAPGHELTLRGFVSDARVHFDCGAGNDDRNDERLSSLALESRDRLGTDWQSTLRLARGSDHSTFSGGFCAGRFDTDSDQAGWQHDFGLAGGRVAAGVEWRRERVAGNTDFVRRQRTIGSAYASYAADWGTHLLQASARRDDNSQFGAHTSASLGYGWRFAPGWRVSALAGTAFKAPSFNDLYIPLTDFSSPGFPFFYSGNPNLRPERAHSVEAALRRDAGAWRAGLTVWQNRVDDLIANGSVGSNPVINTVVNVARARLRGATLDGAWNAGAWTLRGEITHQDAEDADSGRRLPRRAREFASAGVRHDAGAWRSGADLVASGARFDAPDNAASSHLGGYALLDLHAAYAFAPQWTASARLANALDRRYALVQGFATPGRNLFVALEYAGR